MRRTLVLASVLLVSAASGQWLEATIPLKSVDICYNPLGDKVYSVTSSSGWLVLAVIDGATNNIIDTTVQVGEFGGYLCHNPRSNKLYCTVGYLGFAHPSAGVAVLDAVADTVLATVWTGSADFLCCNDSMNKVYCAGSSVTVIDGAGDTLVATVPARGGVLCYNATDNKVYCADYYRDTVTVIDCTADTVLAHVPVGHRPEALCYNPQNNKVYSANWQGHSVTVVDGAGDTVIATVDARLCPVALCYNSRNNKVYCANQSSGNVTVIDGESDSALATVEVGSRPAALCYDPGNNKVYCANHGSQSVPGSTVTVIDGESDSVLVTIDVGRFPHVLCHNPQHSRMYVGSWDDSVLAVIRDSMPGGIAEGVMTEVQPRHPTVLTAPALLKLDCRVVDIQGRDVTYRRGRLAPGVYFLRPAVGHELSAVRKVIVQR